MVNFRLLLVKTGPPFSSDYGLDWKKTALISSAELDRVLLAKSTFLSHSDEGRKYSE